MADTYVNADTEISSPQQSALATLAHVPDSADRLAMTPAERSSIAVFEANRTPLTAAGGAITLSGANVGAIRAYGAVVSGRIISILHLGPLASSAGVVSLRGDLVGDYTITESAFGHHGFEDYLLVDMTGTKSAYASVAISAATVGSSNYDHFKSVQAWAGHGSSGTMGEFYGVDVYSSLAGGTTTKNFGLRIRNPGGAGTITNNYAIYIDPQTRSLNSYTIYAPGNEPSIHYGNLTLGNAAAAAGFLKLTKKILYFEECDGKLGDTGLVGGGAATGHTTLQYYSTNTLTIKRGTTTVATFGGDSSVTFAALAGTGTRTVVVDANGKLSAP